MLFEAGSVVLLSLLLRLVHRQWVYNRALTLVVVLAQEKLVLLDSLDLHLLFLLFGELFVEELLGGDAGFLEEDLGLEPAVGDLEFAFDLLPHEVELIN